MTYTQINAYLSLATALNFSRAARELNISQPTLSNHIRVLEKELGFPLVIRTTHKVELTEQGRIIQAAFCDAVTSIQNGIAGARAVSNSGTIKFGLVHGCHMEDYLKKTFSLFRDDYPKVELNLYKYNSSMLMSELASGALDIAVIPRRAAEIYTQFKGIPLCRSGFGIAVSTGFDRENDICLEKLKDESFIAIKIDECPFVEQKRRHICELNGIKHHKVISVDSVDAQLLYVQSGAGVALLPSIVSIQNPYDKLKIFPLGQEFYEDYYLFRNSDIEKPLVESFFLYCQKDPDINSVYESWFPPVSDSRRKAEVNA